MNRMPIIGGAALVIVVASSYVLSPLTVWFALAIVPAVFYSTRGLDDDDRRLVTALVVAAIALRLLAIAALFFFTDHQRTAFGSFFGDEDYLVKRSLWLRNIALGRPVHPVDLEYAFEPYGRSSYLYLLALVQALVGPSPYGLRLLGVLFYLVAALLLYRLARTSLGRFPALFGLTVLLFLPSLFAWSVSVLKEPVFVLIGALSLVAAVKAAQAASWRIRFAAVAAVLGLAAILQTVRPDGALFALLGAFGGLAIAFVAVRPRLLLAVTVAVPLVLALVFRNPEVQLRTYAAIQSAARQHWGAVVISRGYGYRLLDPRFYPDVNEISDLRLGETLRYAVRGAAAYLTVPLPWNAPSRATVAYLPEQVVWYVLVVLAVPGIVFSFRRNAVVAGLLLAHALLLAAAVAFIDGNVGTLVRHRSLALPYLVWLSGVGACEVFAAAQSLPREPPSDFEPRLKWSSS
jgi:dolichyl-phosphate-mannose-protein mannosyltransferase